MFSVYLSVRKDEFVSPQLQWLHGMLRLANSRQDREQLRRVCKAFYSLEGINLEVADIVSAAAAEDGDFLRAFRRLTLHRKELTESTRLMLKDTIDALADQLDFRGFIRDSFEWFQGFDQASANVTDQSNEFEEEKNVWNALTHDVDAKFGAVNVTLHQLLQELDLQSKTPPSPPGAIPCFTIHASKGMEFGHVYLVGAVEDQLPSWASKKKADDSKEMQEERRNCFVAITGAQESLTITFSKKVFGWAKEPSRFLHEMGLL
jgi:DNA helicase-2/ATP-dependent DNA helicase PcrA